MEKAIGFNCLHYDQPPNEGALEYHYLRNKTFIDETCTDGVRAELMFPSCWNGKDLDSDNHTTHVAYPYEVKYGDCPPGFPVRLPVLFYETIYQTNLFNGSAGEFVLSNGDPTGFGYHGDFIAAWDNGLLQEAIDSTVCTSINSSGLQEDCPVFELQDSYAATECKMEIPEAIQNEPINFVPELPGKIAIQSGPEPATMPGASPSSVTHPPFANSTASALAPYTSPGSTLPCASVKSNISTEVTKSSTVPFVTTTTYMSGTVKVVKVIIEEIATQIEALVATPTVPVELHSAGGHHKRHGHIRGHGEGRVRL